MSKEFKNLAKRLRFYKKNNPRPEFEYTGLEHERHTYCHLATYHNKKLHFFEVRSFDIRKEDITISVVNWTLCAGTATMNLTPKIAKLWFIVEDNPSIQVLHGI